MHKRIWTVVVAVLVVAGLGVAACQAPQGTGRSQTGAAPTETLKIGLMWSISGPAVRVGQNGMRFEQMAIEDVNAKGGVKVGGKVYKLEGVVGDTQYTAEGGRTAADRLVLNEKVKFVTGGFPVDAPGAQPLTEQSKVLLMPFSMTDTGLGPKYPLTLMSGFVHLLMRDPALYAQLVKDHSAVKRVALVSTDDVMGRATETSKVPAATAVGLTMVAKEFFPPSTKDYEPIATRLLREKPDVIDVSTIGGAEQQVVPLVKALRGQGYQGLIQGNAGIVGILRANADLFDGYVFTNLVDPNAEVVSPAERAIARRYVEKYGEAELEPAVIGAYGIPIVLAQGLEKAGTVEDTAKVADVLRAGEWDPGWGASKFVGAKTLGAPSIMEEPVYLSRVENGRVVTFVRVKGTLP